MISNKYKCIYIHIPKCAGTSIDYALLSRYYSKFDKTNKIWEQHASAQQIKSHYASKNQWNNYFKFAIIRNPFDRIVSSYNFLCRRMKPCNFRDRMLFKDFVFRRGEFKDMLYPSLIIKRENEYHQIGPSFSYLFDENNNLLVDHIGKFENLKEEWGFICEQLKVKLKLNHHNKYSRDNKHYRDYYDDETKEFVAKTYEKDLEMFEYKF